jgi:uncharacterized protein (TIGR00369 family)
MEPRTVRSSQVTITELMVPAYANFGGKVHGGFLLSMMDKVAYACASKHAGTYCVTVTVDGVEFLQPVEVGELVSMMASVNHVGRSSMVIGIKVLAENVKTHTVKHTNTSYFTMVAKDDSGKPTQVPELILENMTEVRRFTEAIKRKKYKKETEEKMAREMGEFIAADDMHLLNGERCKLQFKHDDADFSGLFSDT